MLPLGSRVDIGAMTVKGGALHSPKAQHHLAIEEIDKRIM